MRMIKVDQRDEQYLEIKIIINI